MSNESKTPKKLQSKRDEYLSLLSASEREAFYAWSNLTHEQKLQKAIEFSDTLNEQWAKQWEAKMDQMERGEELEIVGPEGNT